MGKDKIIMKSGYLYLDEVEMLLIKNSLQKNKDEDSKKLIAKIDFITIIAKSARGRM